VTSKTNNGEFDVLVLYGYFPTTIYTAGNAQPDGSRAELFIESTDGDLIINHADWMFYVSSATNGPAGLQNMMDNPGIEMGTGLNPDQQPVAVTAEGAAIAPSLDIVQTQRPFHLNELVGE
jgi:hypothetical protein